MNNWKTSAVAAALLSGVTASAQVTEQTVYDNSRIYQEKAYTVTATSDRLEVGDEIRLAAPTIGGGNITRLQIEYYLSPGASGNETAQLSIRQMVDGVPGDLIFQTTPFSIAQPGGLRQLDFDENFVVPYGNTDLMVSLRFGGLEGTEEAGLPFYLGPDVGTSLNDFWVGGTGGFARASTPETSGNFNMRVTAVVPEPGTWAMMIGGLGFLGALTLRRRKA